MPKRRKRKPQRSAKRPSAKSMRTLAAAMEIFEDGDIASARQQLLQLASQYPRSKPILLAILEVSEQTEDWRTFAYYGERLLHKEQGEELAELRNNLIYAYIQLMCPALALQHAQELIVQPTDVEYIDQAKSFVETVEPMLSQEADEIIDSTAFTQGEKFRLMVLHERIRLLTESGHPDEAIHDAELLLEKVPNAIPILNNLSLSRFLTGDVDQAIATAQDVLTQDPDNFHALGNLVRYTFLTARFDEAQSYALRLQQITNDNPDLELKKAEAHSFLGDDAQVWAAYERARNKSKELSPMLLHLAAVAACRLGSEKRAWQLWQEATKLMPSFEMAQASLAEKSLPTSERDIPWYWSFQYWFSQDIGQVLKKHLGKNVQRMSEKRIERGMKSLLVERPYLPKLFPHMLERGDRQTREFVLNYIRIAETPGLLQICYDFAQSPYGADDLRMEAIQFISQNQPAMLPEDKLVPIWINGQQTELLMLGFEITEEPEGFEGVPDKILEKHEQAYDLLMDREPEAAEVILQEIITEAPEFSSAYNQLALAYEMQGRSEEARTLVEETHTRFPDYFFARVALARMKAQDKQLEEARALIQPLVRLSRLHISEFRALAKVQMEISLADNQTEAARTWLEMWEQIEVDYPELIEWKMRIEGPNLMQGLQDLLNQSMKQKPSQRRKK